MTSDAIDFKLSNENIGINFDQVKYAEDDKEKIDKITKGYGLF